ncbi:MAG: ribonuclease Z [Taibaiella sp.]|nr:ribonuclease Z [Taibaiella sp.]
MNVTILGNNSALPAFGRHPTAQALSLTGETILLDCGEGTQVQMQHYGIKWGKINHIFISHMHGDHYFGLFGLVNSMSLLGRTEPLHLYAPPALKGIIDQITIAADSHLAYEFYFHPLLEGTNILVDNDRFRVTAFGVEHRITCHGFLIEQKTKGRKLLPERCAEFHIPVDFYDKLKMGQDYMHADGTIIKNELLTADGLSPTRYAYCADTRFTESFMDVIRGADTIYHECTYLQEDEVRATLRFHSTTAQAARIAVIAGAKQLLLGHFSSRYKELDAFQAEAAAIFPNVHVTVEGTTYEI